MNILPLFLLLVTGEVPPPPKLIVNWWTSNDIAAMTKAPPECGKQQPKVEPFTATLLICPGGDPWAPVAVAQAENCRAMEPRPLSSADRAGSLVFEKVPAGAHLIRFTAGSGEPVFRTVRMYGDETSEEHVEVRWPTIFGKVTKKGEPFHGRVFDTAVTDPETGSYTATLSRLPVDPTLSVQPCDGSQTYWFVAEPQPVENARYDIEMPSNRIDVDVVDAETGEPLKDARVSYRVPHEDKPESVHFSMTGGRSDEKGRVTISPVVAKRKLTICGRHEDYELTCSDAFKLTATEEKSVRLALSRSEKHAGRVLTPGKSEVWWHAPNGSAERVVTDEEGRFTYKRPHSRGEIVTVSSAAGFFVLTQPALEAGEVFTIRPPHARVRTFEVHLAKTSTDEMGYFTISLGDLIVPHEPFSSHVMRASPQSALHPGWTATVPNVFETAPISVIYAPRPFLEPRMPNWWLVPEARTLPRRALGDQAKIVID